MLGTTATTAAVLALTLAAGQGWTAPATLIALGAAALLLAGFLGHEATGHTVLIERPLRRSPSLRAGALAAAFYMASMGTTYYLLTLLFQPVWGYTPWQAGLAFLPLTLAVSLGGPTAERALRRVSCPTVLVGGFALGLLGLSWLALTATAGSYLVLLPGAVLAGLGNGMVFTAMFVLGTSDIAARHQGAAAGLLVTSQYVAGALALAVVTLGLGPTRHPHGLSDALLITAIAAAAGLLHAALRRNTQQPDEAS